MSQGGSLRTSIENVLSQTGNNDDNDRDNGEIVDDKKKPSKGAIQKRRNQKYSCRTKGCNKPDNDEMVQCDACHMWHHYGCVGVDHTVEDREWRCLKCDNTSAKSSRPSEHRLAIELQMLEEQKRLRDKRIEEEKRLKEQILADENERIRKEKEKINEEYLKQLRENDEAFVNSKIDLLSESVASSKTSSRRASSISSSQKQTAVTKWLENQTAQNPKCIKPKNHEKQPNPPAQVMSSTPYIQQKNDLPSRSNQRKSAGPIPILSQQQNQFVESTLNQNTFTVPDITFSNQFAARQVLGRIELPIFNGNPLDWPMFISTFNQTSEQCGYTNNENILRLQKSLKGDALELVRSSLIYADSVPSIIESLQQMFGQPETILCRLVKRIREMPAVKFDRFDMLIKFSIETKNLYATMAASQLTEHLNNPMLRQELVEKLPYSLKLEWGHHRITTNNSSLLEFINWLSTVAKAASLASPEMNPFQWSTSNKESNSKASIKKTSTKKKPEFQLTAVHNVETASSSCPICHQKSHQIENCGEFLKLKPSKRIDRTAQLHLCRTCLRQHNSYCNVKKRCEVDGCQRFHHSLLHKSKTVDNANHNLNSLKSPVRDQQESSTQYNHNHRGSLPKTLYRTLPIYLFGPENCVKTFAMFDEGSSITLLEEAVADELQLNGPTIDLHLKWTGEMNRVEENSRVVSVEISGISPGDVKYKMHDIRTVQNLDLPKHNISSAILNKCKHLAEVPTSTDIGRPTIIIGLDQYKLGLPLDVREGGENEPIATRTRLGWTICGQTKLSKDDVRVCVHKCDCDAQLHSAVKQFFSLENFGINSKKILEDKEVERARRIMSDTTCFKDGRYEVGLLWRHDNIVMPESKHMALQRLRCFERKLMKNSDLKNAVNEKILEYLRKGYVKWIRELGFYQFSWCKIPTNPRR